MRSPGKSRSRQIGDADSSSEARTRNSGAYAMRGEASFAACEPKPVGRRTMRSRCPRPPARSTPKAVETWGSPTGRSWEDPSLTRAGGRRTVGSVSEWYELRAIERTPADEEMGASRAVSTHTRVLRSLGPAATAGVLMGRREERAASAGPERRDGSGIVLRIRRRRPLRGRPSRRPARRS